MFRFSLFMLTYLAFSTHTHTQPRDFQFNSGEIFCVDQCVSSTWNILDDTLTFKAYILPCFLARAVHSPTCSVCSSFLSGVHSKPGKILLLLLNSFHFVELLLYWVYLFIYIFYSLLCYTYIIAYIVLWYLVSSGQHYGQLRLFKCTNDLTLTWMYGRTRYRIFLNSLFSI